MDWETVVRFINVCMSAVGAILLMRKYFLYWDEYQSRTKDFWWVLMFWCLAIGLGTLEVLMNWGTNYRVLFTFLALVLTIKLLLKPNEVEKPTFTNEF